MDRTQKEVSRVPPSDEEGAADAVIRDDRGKAFEDTVKHILDKNSALDRMHHLEQLYELVLAPDDDVGQEPQLPAQLGQGFRGVFRQLRRAMAAAELADPIGISIQPILQSVWFRFIGIHAGSNFA